MSAFILAVIFTLIVSAFCSLLEAFILSVTTAEIEELRKDHPALGRRLERFKEGIDETSSAILTLNTIANTMGAALAGWLAGQLFSSAGVGIASGLLVLGILFFSEIIPKNIGVAYRKPLGPFLVYPLLAVRILMRPFSYLAKHSVRPFLAAKEEVTAEEKEREIILLAEKRAKEGSLTPSERDMIMNALSLDDVKVGEIMSPRTVVSVLEENQTVGEICRENKVIPFARMPVYREEVDHIVGMVRRRDILQRHAEDKDETRIAQLMSEILFIPETANALHALQLFLKKNQQMALVVDEFGSNAGVVTMEDIVEHILGREIYEASDVAVDMRELAREQARQNHGITSGERTGGVI